MVVSGTCGTAVSNTASLVVNSPVLVSSAPLSQTNCPGANATFNVSATGTGLTYQWYKGSTPISGQTASSLNLLGISANDQAAYSVVVSGTCGTAVSNTASLVVNSPVLVSQPAAQPDQLPGRQRHLQCQRHRHRPELPMV